MIVPVVQFAGRAARLVGDLIPCGGAPPDVHERPIELLEATYQVKPVASRGVADELVG